MTMDLLDIFGTRPAAGDPAQAPAVISTTEVEGGVHRVQGVSEEFLAEIYYGEVPVSYTADEVIAQTIAFIEREIETHGSCIIRNMPNWVYHGVGLISSTLLKGYAANPRTCKKPYQAKDDANVGSGIHALSLQGQEGLDAECAIMPIECEGRSKKAIAAREEFESLHPGKVPLPYRYGKDEDGDKPYIMEVLRGVDASFREHPVIGPLLANSEKELSLFWRDEKSGCTCKARLDIYAGAVIGDVKKCRDLDGFNWQIKDLHYGVQAGLYMLGAIACGLPVTDFAFLPCEAFHPYRVGFGIRKAERLQDDMIEAQRLIGLVKESTLTRYWPNFAVPQHIFTLSDIQPEDLVLEF